MRSSAVLPDAKEFLAAAIFFITTFFDKCIDNQYAGQSQSQNIGSQESASDGQIIRHYRRLCRSEISRCVRDIIYFKAIYS